MWVAIDCREKPRSIVNSNTTCFNPANDKNNLFFFMVVVGWF
jgi:hypothetical protein